MPLENPRLDAGPASLAEVLRAAVAEGTAEAVAAVLQMCGTSETASSVVPDPALRPTLTVEEGAAIYGISENSLRQAISAGEVPSIRLGRRVLLPTAGVRRQLLIDPPADEVEVSATADEMARPLRPVRSGTG